MHETQEKLTFRRNLQVVNPPVDAPSKVLRQIDSDAQALAVSMKAGGHKLACIAKAVGKTEGYVSRLRSGKRPIPEALVDRLCIATGSNLLRQYRELQAALSEVEDERANVRRLAAQLADWKESRHQQAQAA